jgi:hypothetical protein
MEEALIMGEILTWPGIKKKWQWETEEVVLEEGDALFLFSENGASQRLYLTKEDSWPSFMARVIIHVLQNQYIFDQCANDCVRKMTPEERTVFSAVLKDHKYVD